MPLTYIQLEKFSNWQEYYWTYQNVLAKEYYIPLLKKWERGVRDPSLSDA